MRIAEVKPRRPTTTQYLFMCLTNARGLGSTFRGASLAWVLRSLLRSLAFRAALLVRGRSHPAQVVDEPVTGQHRDPLERAGLLEEVGRAGNDDEFARTGIMAWARRFRSQHQLIGPPTMRSVGATTLVRPRPPVGPAAAGHHRRHPHTRIGGSGQGRARAGAGTEVADRQRGGVG